MVYIILFVALSYSIIANLGSLHSACLGIRGQREYIKNSQGNRDIFIAHCLRFTFLREPTGRRWLRRYHRLITQGSVSMVAIMQVAKGEAAEEVHFLHLYSITSFKSVYSEKKQEPFSFTIVCMILLISRLHWQKMPLMLPLVVCSIYFKI